MFQNTFQVYAYFPRARWYDYSTVRTNIVCEEPGWCMQSERGAWNFLLTFRHIFSKAIISSLSAMQGLLK